MLADHAGELLARRLRVRPGDELREQLAREAAAHAQLREELGALARAASDSGAEKGGAASLAAAAMEKALLAILDGEENEADALPMRGCSRMCQQL